MGLSERGAGQGRGSPPGDPGDAVQREAGPLRRGGGGAVDGLREGVSTGARLPGTPRDVVRRRRASAQSWGGCGAVDGRGGGRRQSLAAGTPEGRGRWRLPGWGRKGRSPRWPGPQSFHEACPPVEALPLQSTEESAGSRTLRTAEHGCPPARPSGLNCLGGGPAGLLPGVSAFCLVAPPHVCR